MASRAPNYAELFDESEELAYLVQRDQVSDEDLTARMLSAPDCGGSLLVELSEFVARRRDKDASQLAMNCPAGLEPDDAN